MRLRNRIARVAAALLLLGLPGWRWRVSIGAAATETAWGAADPSWPPDGRLRTPFPTAGTPPWSPGASRDVFDTMLGAKEIPIGAALGAVVDSIDILPFGAGAYEPLVPPVQLRLPHLLRRGAGVFANWRGIDNIPGGSQQDVELGPAMNWGRGVERFREGRSFVTNGPLIAFPVDGTGVGR